jgi:hypothetical protein
MNDATNIMSKEQWDEFVKGELLVILAKYNLQKIMVDDGAGKRGVIRVNAHGEHKVQITSNETL